jgi:hypothetical protein
MSKRALRLGLIGWSILAGAAGLGAEFRTPKDPPKSRYRIEAAVDLQRRSIGGTETVTLVNTTGRALDRIALDWQVSASRSIEVRAQGRLLNGSPSAGPLFYNLPAAVPPKGQLILTVGFAASDLIDPETREIKLVRWYPRLWWNDLPVHDAYEVKIETPDGFAIATSGRRNLKTGFYEIDGARTFGLYFGRDMIAEEREADGVLVRAVFTAAGADCARLCLSTAVDVINFYKSWIGFYPFPALAVIPGGTDPWGGYPFATGIVVVHGQEKLAAKNADYWQWITSHEIGHQYWGEYVLDPDIPAWLWIGLGIFTDREYTRHAGLSPDRHPGFFATYLAGAERRLDTTIDIPPAREEEIEWDRNNIVVHGKGFAVISALESVLGRDVFLKVFNRCLREYGGRRLGWMDFRRTAEEESGSNLAWFFDAWVRSNECLCYKAAVEAGAPGPGGFDSSIRIEALGTMRMPIPVRVEFEDGTSRMATADRFQEITRLRIESRSPIKAVTIDPEHLWAMRTEPLPETAADLKKQIIYRLPSTGAGERGRRAYDKAITLGLADKDAWFRLGLILFDGGYWSESFEAFSRFAAGSPDPFERFTGLTWMGMLKDLLGEREAALTHYQEALKYDTGRSIRHDQFGLRIDEAWIEERLKTPFRRRRG